MRAVLDILIHAFIYGAGLFAIAAIVQTIRGKW
jgi:hypothetical protein